MAGGERQWKAVEVEGAPAPAGAYSRAIRAGEWLFVSGQVPREFDSGELMGEDIESQTRAVLGNLRRVLRAAGADMSDVVSVTVYLADMADWGAFDDVYREAFEAPFPTRTTVGAQLHGVLVEISAVARVGTD
ncbi:MAG TPA: RidA family protein [Longimicrobiales bacterium]|nr:RidA family protein [Longimicrobiales bacterium]